MSIEQVTLTVYSVSTSLITPPPETTQQRPGILLPLEKEGGTLVSGEEAKLKIVDGAHTE